MNPINWNETYTNISPKLLGICRRYIKDIATAEDIVQDSFIVAIQKEHSLKDINSLHGWLSRIVINMAIHHIKETKKTTFSTANDFDLVDNYTLMETLELDNKSRLLASDLDRNDVLEAIDNLPDHHKSVFNMYVIDQFSHNDIAKTLDISVGTSKSHLSRARKSIQTFLLEKIKEKPVDEKKKRRLAFLIILGFGNSLFANFYQTKFQDFEIVAKNPFSITPKTISTPTNFVGLTKVVSLTKIIAISSIAACVFVVGFYLNDSHKSVKIQNTTIEKNSNSNIISKTNASEIETNLPIKTDSEKVSEKTIMPKKEKNSIKKIFENEKPVVELKKDSSVSENPKVIVIKKQIIKRDTIYVTK